MAPTKNDDADKKYPHVLLDQVHLDEARRPLADCGLSVTAIAFRPGYAEVSAVSHAFARWTGLAPDRYRTAAGPG